MPLLPPLIVWGCVNTQASVALNVVVPGIVLQAQLEPVIKRCFCWSEGRKHQWNVSPATFVASLVPRLQCLFSIHVAQRSEAYTEDHDMKILVTKRTCHIWGAFVFCVSRHSEWGFWNLLHPIKIKNKPAVSKCNLAVMFKKTLPGDLGTNHKSTSQNTLLWRKWCFIAPYFIAATRKRGPYQFWILMKLCNFLQQVISSVNKSEKRRPSLQDRTNPAFIHDELKQTLTLRLDHEVVAL